MKIDIVIPCCSEDFCVLDSVRSIQKSALSETHVKNIFVVFNPKQPTWAEELKQLDDRIITLVSPKRNVNLARNLGLQRSSAEICLFLDADCEVDYDLINRHLTQHQEQQDVTAIGGLYSNLKCKTRVQYAYSWLQKKWLLGGQLLGGCNPNLLGGNVSYKRPLLAQNRFCPEISFGASETELHYRLFREGHKLVLNSSLIVHHNSSVTFFSLLKKAFLQGHHSNRLTLSQQTERKVLSLDFLNFIESKSSGFRFSFLLFAFAFSFKVGQLNKKNNIFVAILLTLRGYTSEAIIHFQDHAAAHAIRNQKARDLIK